MKSKKINLAITGCMGRMGQQLITSVKKDKSFKLKTITENRKINKKINGLEINQNSEETFKKVNLRGSRSFMVMVVAAILIGLMFTVGRKFALPVGVPVLFIIYLLYGFVRPYIPRGARKDLEENTQ